MGSNDGSVPQGHAPLPPPRAEAPVPPPPAPPQPPFPAGAVRVPDGPVPQRRRTGLIVAAVATALTVAVVAVVVLMSGGGDDTPASAPASTARSRSSTTSATVADTEVALPVITAPTVTVTTPQSSSPLGDVATVGVTDDSRTFTVYVPTSWSASTEERNIFGAPAAGISASPDLSAYRAGDDEDGVTAAVIPSGDVGGAFGLASTYLAAVDSCVAEDWQSGHRTAWGPAEVLLLDGCGTGGMYAKTVLMVDTFVGTVMVAVQGLGPADGDLLVLAQAFIDTLVFS